MPTTGTQTPWSWLQDLAANAHLRPLGVAEAGEQAVDADSCDGRSCEAHGTGDGQEAITTPPSPEEAGVPSKAQSPEGLRLPPLEKGECSQQERSKPVQEELKLPPVLMQLQDCRFSSASDDSADEREEEEDSEAEDKFPDLTLPNLPWPTILQYLRESESIASEYFSLENKQKLSDHHSQIESSGMADRKGSLFPDKCDFCGMDSQRHSLLNLTEDEAETSFCCEEYKEFCLLIAGCMRQMVERRKHERPKKISIEPSKKTYKETAEEKAMAMLCRKKKLEELRKKRKQMEKLQSSSFYSLTKQTKTIQFSLVSPTAQHTEWLISQGPSSSQPQATHSRVVFRKNKGRKKKDEEKRFEELPQHLADRLQQEAPPLGELDVRHYSNRTKLATILPDGTGQCYYLSGNTAVMMYMPYQGVLAYLLFEDSDHPRLLAHIDELGRACCYHPDGGIRFLRTPLAGLLFDQHGSLKKRWVWKDCSKATSLFQPVTVAFSKQLSLRCTGQEMMLIQFSAQHHQLKFSVASKIKDTECEVLADRQVAERVRELEIHHHATKARISQLMLALQQSHRVQKLAELHSVYAPRGSKHGHSESVYAARSRHAGHSEAHKKTRSTGALNLHKPATKHTTTTALKPLLP